MQYLKNALINNTPKARETHIMELNKEFLIDIHNRKIINKNEYIKKMSLSATNGGVWGDFTAIKWISKYLKKSDLYMECIEWQNIKYFWNRT